MPSHVSYAGSHMLCNHLRYADQYLSCEDFLWHYIFLLQSQRAVLKFLVFYLKVYAISQLNETLIFCWCWKKLSATN